MSSSRACTVEAYLDDLLPGRRRDVAAVPMGTDGHHRDGGRLRKAVAALAPEAYIARCPAARAQ